MMGEFKIAIDYHKHCVEIAKDVADKAEEGIAWGNLGNAYQSLGDFKTAFDYYKRYLEIAEEVGDKAEEGMACGSLGNAYRSLGDLKTAIQYHERQLKIAKEVGHKCEEGKAYGFLGNDYQSLGDFETALYYHGRHLKIAKEVRDKTGEGIAHGNLGIAYRSLGDSKTAFFHQERDLRIAREVGDKPGEGRAYGNLGIAYHSLGNCETAIDYFKRQLKIAKEVGDKCLEGMAYSNIGNAFQCLGDFKTANEYHKRSLEITKTIKDKAGEGKAYANLGNVFQSLGDFKTAIEYYERNLRIVKELEDKAGEGRAYGRLGNAFQSSRKFKSAIDYHERHLKIAKEVGEKAEEGLAYGNLGTTYQSLGDFKRAIEYCELDLKIAKEVGDIAGEGRACGSLGTAYQSLGDSETAIEYHERSLEIAKEVGNIATTAVSFYNLAGSFALQRSLSKAVDCLHSSVRMLNIVRHDLKGKDEWKIIYRNKYKCAYTGLWRLLLKQGEVERALFAADQGRAQALNDLMEFNYGLKTTYSQLHNLEEITRNSFSFPRSVTVFLAIDEQEIVFWVIQEGKHVALRKKELNHDSSLNLDDVLGTLIKTASQEIGVGAGTKCEDRSLDNLRDEQMVGEGSPQTPPKPVPLQMNTLRTLYDVTIDPIVDLVLGDELVLVPEGPLCLAPFAVFVDSNSRYLCDFCRIRVIPSLTSLKLITDSPAGYHSKIGVLLVGDPWVEEVVIAGSKLEELPCAREEVQMIGRIFNTKPLIGKDATKDEVLSRLPSVALIHIAAHGRMETGEIALAPNITPASQEDFLLTMKDVTSAQIRARLVVLSCCHSGRGEIKAEGVVGIARAFLGAGARAVLVSLWAIDDDATLEFMKSFYSHLVKGISASESLNKAMKHTRESDQFNEVKHWAPFVLIGDDVTLNFDGSE